LCWDVHWLIYVTRAAHEAGAEAKLAASRKLEKCANIDAWYLVKPIAVETLGVINTTACHLLLNDLGRKMSTVARLERPASCINTS